MTCCNCMVVIKKHGTTMVCLSLYYHGMFVIVLPWYFCHCTTMVFLSLYYHGIFVIILPWYVCHCTTMVCLSLYYHGRKIPWYFCYCNTMVFAQVSWYFPAMVVTKNTYFLNCTSYHGTQMKRDGTMRKIPWFYSSSM
jgi:hypothetical protein